MAVKPQYICDWICKKRSSHTSDLPTLMTIDLKFGQQEVPTQMDSWTKFQLSMSFDNQVDIPSLQNWMCLEDPFCKSRHIQ